jgi:hypothetical protein
LAEVTNNIHGHEHEIEYYKKLENTNIFILGQEMNISVFLVVTYCANFHPHYQQGCPKCQASQLCFAADFTAFNLKLSKAIQNVGVRVIEL